MATISRLKAAEISNGNVINADYIEAELDQLVGEANSKETRLDDLETGTMSISGVKTFSDGIKTDTVDEETSAAGVTIDGVLLKDSFVGAGQVSGAGVNAQTGTTYTVLTGDRNKLVTFSNASPIAVTLPQAGSTGFADNYVFTAVNLGAGLVTITPTTSTIDGASTLTLATNQGVMIFSDGTNYFTNRGRTGPFSESYTSSDQTITNSGDLSLSHGLSSTPYLIMPYLKCNTGELGYTAGDEIPIGYESNQNGETNRYLQLIPDASNIEVRYGSNVQAWSIVRKDTNAQANITGSNWRFVVRAWV